MFPLKESVFLFFFCCTSPLSLLNIFINIRFYMNERVSAGHWFAGLVHSPELICSHFKRRKIGTPLKGKSDRREVQKVFYIEVWKGGKYV